MYVFVYVRLTTWWMSTCVLVLVIVVSLCFSIPWQYVTPLLIMHALYLLRWDYWFAFICSLTTLSLIMTSFPTIQQASLTQHMMIGLTTPTSTRKVLPLRLRVASPRQPWTRTKRTITSSKTAWYNGGYVTVEWNACVFVQTMNSLFLVHLNKDQLSYKVVRRRYESIRKKGNVGPMHWAACVVN